MFSEILYSEDKIESRKRDEAEWFSRIIISEIVLNIFGTSV